MTEGRGIGDLARRALGVLVVVCAGAVLWASCARPIGDTCGNGACDANETELSCPTDCMPMPACGDGNCDPSETMLTCPADCTGLPNCGNGLCDAGESGATCPQDCLANCGNGICDPGEGTTCPTDCATCGNAICDPGEDSTNCPGDCPVGPVCGNGICEAGEDSATCLSDCPVMGTDAGTDSGMPPPPWVPPPSDGVPCAPEACPVDAPNCVGPDDANAYCRADCNSTLVPDPCEPNYDCVELSSGAAACMPAAATGGCCNACGCLPSDICVSIDMMSPVCLVECDPAAPVQCSPGDTCVMLTGGTSTLGGACLPAVQPMCSGVPSSEAMCI